MTDHDHQPQNQMVQMAVAAAGAWQQAPVSFEGAPVVDVERAPQQQETASRNLNPTQKKIRTTNTRRLPLSHFSRKATTKTPQDVSKVFTPNGYGGNKEARIKYAVKVC